MKIRFEIPALRLQFDRELVATPREGETVYLTIRQHRRLFVVKRVVWFPDERDEDFDVYIVLHKGR